jgi:hypothetical protein
MSKQVVLLDVVCYITFPLVAWHVARDHMATIMRYPSPPFPTWHTRYTAFFLYFKVHQ